MSSMPASVPLALCSGAVCAGFCVALLVDLAATICMRETARESQSWEFDQVRLAAIRRGSPLMRWCEPFVRGIELSLPYWPFVSRPGLITSVQRDLNRGGSPLPLRAEEFLALSLFQAMLASLATGVLSLAFVNWLPATVGIIGALVLFIVIAIRDLQKLAKSRLELLKQQLPFCIDLLALMMDAGEEFLPSMQTLVERTEGTIVGDEFARILRHTQANVPLSASLQELAERMSDVEISEVTTAVIRGNENGAPLHEIFNGLADELRLRRTQWIEKRAGQLQTMITFPNFVVMCACLLVIVVPFALTLMLDSPFNFP